MRSAQLALILLLAFGVTGSAGVEVVSGKPCRFEEGGPSPGCPDSRMVCLRDPRPDAPASGRCLYPCETTADCGELIPPAGGCSTYDVLPLYCVDGGCVAE